MTFKSISDMKFYLYLSRAKLNMLYRQIDNTGKRKASIEWKVDLKAFSITKKSETESDIDDDDKLKAVIAELESQELIGTLEDNKPYIKSIFPMRWGVYDDSKLRPDNEGPLVWFSGIQNRLLLGLGGSSHHIEGCYGMTSTASRSSTAALVNFLRTGMETGETKSLRRPWHEPHDYDCEIGSAMALANHYLRGPVQNLEFVAKVLWSGDPTEIIPWDSDGHGRAILATPLYVAQVDPMDVDD
jgi:hypothetical protein